MIEYTVKVYESGYLYWCLNGQLHREDGPAVEWADGSKYWCLNGQLHREDGPAVERSDGTKIWCLNGQLMTEAEHKAATQPAVEMSMTEVSEQLGYIVKIIKGNQLTTKEA